MPKKRVKLDYSAVLPALPRTVNRREYSLCIIAVEGAAKEPGYFKRFGSNRLVVKTLGPTPGESNEPEGLLAQLAKFFSQQDIQPEDTCWLVFDVDHRTQDTLISVFRAARRKRFNVAISNPCFEFWLFLHKFEHHQVPAEVLSAPLNDRSKVMKRYVGYDHKNRKLFQFREDVEDAIRRANAQAYTEGTVPFPGTTVHELVKTLPLTGHGA